MTGVWSYARLERKLARNDQGVYNKALHTLATCDRGVDDVEDCNVPYTAWEG